MLKKLALTLTINWNLFSLDFKKLKWPVQIERVSTGFLTGKTLPFLEDKAAKEG